MACFPEPCVLGVSALEADGDVAALAVQVMMSVFIAGIYSGAPSNVEARKVSQALVGAAWHSERGKLPLSSCDAASVDGDLECVLATTKLAARMPVS